MKYAAPPPSTHESAGRKLWIIFCLLGALLLTACGNAARPESIPESVGETTVSETASLYDDSLLSEVNFHGSYREEGWQDGIAYDYRMPQILDDTPDAEEVNAEFRRMGREAEEGRVFYDRITWERHWNGSLLSLVVTMRQTYQADLGYFT